jgi:magnesium-transporting ATPase (P-type)
MTVIYHDLEVDSHVAFMKGAPERVLEACTDNFAGDLLTPKSKDHILSLMDHFASEGLVPLP